MKRGGLFFLIVALLITSCCSCANINMQSDNTRSFTDSEGFISYIPNNVESVVCMSNYCAQILVGLGQGSKIVGMTDEAIESPWMEYFMPNFKEAKIYSPNESAESLLRANADVVIFGDAVLASEYRKKGVNAVTLSFFSVTEYEDYIKKLCELVGDDAIQTGQRYIDYFHKNIDMVDCALEGKLKEPESLYYINGVSNKGLIKTAGKGSTNSELAALSHVVFSTDRLLESPTNKVDEEAIIKENPDNIIIGGAYKYVLLEELYSSIEWGNVKAVKENHVYIVPTGIAPWNRYGIEMALMIPWTASVVYPELMEYNIIDEIIKFYGEFAGVSVSESDAINMIAGASPTGEY